MGLLGPGPGCKELFAGYLQFIISHVIASLVLTVLGSLTIQAGLPLPLQCCWGGTGAETCQSDMLVPQGWDGSAGWQLSGKGLHVDLLPRLVPQPWLGLSCQGFPMLLSLPLPVGSTRLANAPSSCPRGAGGTAAPTARLPMHAGSLAASLGRCFSEINSRSSQPC